MDRPTRHRRRFHTDRIVSNRRAAYLRSLRHWETVWPRKLQYGHLADRDPWDCGSHCLLCHGEKFVEPRRTREKRAWRADWGL